MITITLIDNTKVDIEIDGSLDDYLNTLADLEVQWIKVPGKIGFPTTAIVKIEPS